MRSVIPQHCPTALHHLCASVLLAMFLAGCSIKLVSDYDSASIDQLLGTYQEVDQFYDRLAETPSEQRTYEAFQQDWSSISTDLRTFALRQGVRQLNEESASIAEALTKAWERERTLHKGRSADPGQRNDPYPDTRIALDRQQFEDWFYAAMFAEKSKK